MQLNMTDDVRTKLRISAILFKNHVPVEEAKFIGKYIEDLEEKNRMFVQMERNTYETSQEIMAELTSEKQELIDYLKEKIKQCEELIIKHKDCIKGVVNISDDNRHIILIKQLKIEKDKYQEILSKIEKE